MPFYDGLTVMSFLQFAKAYPQVGTALPALDREVEKLPRAYIANVVYTLVGKPFQEWVDS